MERKNVLALLVLIAIAAVGVLLFATGDDEAAEPAAEIGETNEDGEGNEDGEQTEDAETGEPDGPTVSLLVTAAESAGENDCLDNIKHEIEFVLRDSQNRAVGLASLGSLDPEDCSTTQRILIERVGESVLENESDAFDEAIENEVLMPTRIEVRYDTVPVAIIPVSSVVNEDTNAITGWSVVNDVVLTPVELPDRYAWDNPLEQLDSEENSSTFDVEPFAEIDDETILEETPEIVTDKEADGDAEPDETGSESDAASGDVGTVDS